MGIGTTLVEALRQGRHAIGVEYEPRWAATARANLTAARRHGTTHTTGKVICADARHPPRPSPGHWRSALKSSYDGQPHTPCPPALRAPGGQQPLTARKPRS